MPQLRPRFAVVLIVILIAVAVATVWIIMPRLSPHDARPLDVPIVADAERLIRAKNRAVGQLENGDFDDCNPVFAELAEELPDDPLGPRNLVIGRLLALEQLDRQSHPMEFKTAGDRLSQAVNMMLAREANSAVPELLAGRAKALLDDFVGARQAFSKATELAPQDPIAWFELFALGRNSKETNAREQSWAALESAYRLQPANLFLLLEWMLHQAEMRDEAIVETIQAARSAFEPLVETVRQQSRVDVANKLEGISTAVTTADWNVVLREVRILANVIRPDEAVQGDRRQVSRHSLEFALLDFRPAVYESFKLQQLAETLPFLMRYEQAASENQPPAVEQALALKGVDFDLDGTSDVVVLRAGRIEAYGRTEQKGPWRLLTNAEVPAGASGFLAVDLDSDSDTGDMPRVSDGDRSDAGSRQSSIGPTEFEVLSRGTSAADADLDIVVFGNSGLAVLENARDSNTGRRTLVPMVQSDDFAALRQVLTVAAADLDHDGDLDLVVSTTAGLSLWSNRGDRTFENISTRAQLPPADLQVTAIVPLDWDRDVDTDLLLAGRNGPIVGLLENVRHGRFRWRELETGLTDLAASALVAVDADANAAWDFVVAGDRGAKLLCTAASATGPVAFLPSEAVATVPLAGMISGDLDNDGYLDLVGLSDGALVLLRGTLEGRFEPLSDVAPLIDGLIRDMALADVDGDGDLDLWIATPLRVDWLVNDGGNRNHWIDVALKAAQVKGTQLSASGRVNHYGVGSLVELKAGLAYQARVVTEQKTHFGLGTRDRADVLRVLWSNGMPHDVLEPKSDQVIFEQQTLKGSCPYLYTWNGSRFEFWTDLLWAAPLGLQFGEGIIAPARDWEYLKIDGDRLCARDGRYPIQITEELWEAAYYDQAKLIAVDHPNDVEIFSNEKVGPAEIAEFRVHTVRKRRVPVAARDRRDRDVLSQIAAEDGQFLKGFDRKLRQGLTEEHFLELDLGKLDSPKKILLFLTGWVYPSDTSINVALSQSADLPSPKPPALWVPAGGGEWREALPYMGFPGGKTKTIAIDLTGLFANDDYRLRIVTSMEIYWDAAFFSVDEEPAPFELRELPLVSADLHFRGYSHRVPNAQNGPEFYDYARISTEPRWPPLEGRFTRYGDVFALMKETDDRLVVLAQGDEMSLEFAAPEENPPPGWKRDFLLYNVGWDKDADLNTVYGQTVEPLPFRSMGRYPFPEAVTSPEDAAYLDYIERYQTRIAPQQRFWKGIRRYERRSSGE